MRIALRPLGMLVGCLLAAVMAVQGRTVDKPTTYPRQVLIIRHAEKPTDDAKSPDLTPEGKDRAEALYKLFEPSDTRTKPFPTPDFIIAGKDTKKSHRPVQTVTPLAKKLKLTLDTEYGNEDMDKLAAELFQNPKYADKTILISWRHSTIPQLAAKLKAPDVPDNWKGEVYDRVWQITYDKQGKTIFADLPQRLMPKDSDK